MIKKISLLTLIATILLLAVGCSNDALSPANSGNGTGLNADEGLVVIGISQSKVLNVSSIASFDITLKGSGMTAQTGNIVLGGTLSIAVTAGENRVICVVAKDASDNEIPGLVMYGYVDVTAGGTSTAIVTWDTTPAGAILESLLDNYSTDLSTIDDGALQSLVNSSTEQKLINAVANASYYNTNGAFSSPLILYSASSVSGILRANDVVSAPPGTPLGSGYIVKCRDRLSAAVVSASGGVYSISDIVPGDRVIEVYANGVFVGSRSITIPEGTNLTNIDIETDVEPDQAGDLEIEIDPGDGITANAGSDIVAFAGDTVTLDGSGSTGTITSYLWEQISGPSVTITNATSSVATCIPPSNGTYVFRLTVTDGSDIDQDTVEVEARELAIWQDFNAATVGVDSSAQNLLGQYDWWYDVDEGATANTISTSNGYLTVDANGAVGNAFAITYTLGGDGNSGNGMPKVGYGSESENGEETAYDLSGYNGFSFWSKLDGDNNGSLHFEVYTTDMTASWDVYKADFTLTSDWAQYSFDFSELAQTGYEGADYTFDPSLVYKIQICIDGNQGDTATLYLDEISLY